MSEQLTVGQLREALKQLPDDSLVFKGEGFRSWKVRDMEALRFLVWPRISGPAHLVIGSTYETHFALKAYGVEPRRLLPNMELPEDPRPKTKESAQQLEALEISGWPWGVEVLRGDEEVSYKEEFIEDWEAMFGPLPEWANIIEEDHGDG